MFRGCEPTAALYAFEDTSVRLDMTVDVSEDAVNSELWTIQPGVLIPLSQHVTRRIVWDWGACLFLKRWGAYPKRWCMDATCISCSAQGLGSEFSWPPCLQQRYGLLGEEETHGGIREVYRDLADIICKHFCYNRPNRYHVDSRSL